MSKADTLPALSEEEVRSAVNRWNDQGYFRIKNLGDKIFIDAIDAKSSYTVQLRTEYEERSVAEVSVPHAGGSVDDRGMPPGPWDIEVRRPAGFEDRTETVPVPHTERVKLCPRCAGQGRVDCSPCSGSGRVNCSFCHGKGYRERQEMRPDRDAHGNPTHRPVTVKENCTCFNGKVTCNSCTGNGRVVCSSCAGSGYVKTFDQLTVQFRCETRDQVLDDTDVPDQLIAGLSGEVMVDEEAPRLENVPEVTPETDRQVKSMLEKSQAIDEKHARILLQHLHVERVAIQEVRYRYAGAERQLWICGKEKCVHAPGVPWQSKQLALILGGVVAAVIAVVVLLILFLSR